MEECRQMEYLQQLFIFLVPLIYEGFEHIYSSAKLYSVKDNELYLFQLFLKETPQWTPETITHELNRIQEKAISQNINLDLLLKCVIKSYLSAFLKTDDFDLLSCPIQKSISLSAFIHKCYIKCSKNIYHNPYLFYETKNRYNNHRRILSIYKVIKESINESVTSLFPMNQIMSAYLQDTFLNTEENLSKTAITLKDFVFLMNTKYKILYDKYMRLCKDYNIDTTHGIYAEDKSLSYYNEEVVNVFGKSDPNTDLSLSVCLSRSNQVPPSDPLDKTSNISELNT
ncbi:hypothetical protein nvc1_066 [Namao virus]|nr:hypothetical protein nvc1_066 [Namao virus]